MLRLLAFVVVVSLFAGCASERVAVDDAESPSAKAAGVFLPPNAADGFSILVAPPVVLESLAGRQEAVRGSSCVANGGGGGVAVCSDPGAVHPGWLSVVRPGETVTVALVGASLVGSSGVARARPLGCGGTEATTFPLDRTRTVWKVALAPGAYELEVAVAFETADGRSGDVSGALGLLVDPEREPGILPASVSSGSSC
jgi:hypothetical protein